MQKAHDLWEGFNTFSRLLRGYYRAARGKADRESVLNFHRNLEANLFALREELENGTYQWGPYRSFWVEDPKRRMIEAAPFRDRVVHQAIHEILLPLVESSFYSHSYACLKGRGTHRAVTKLHSWAHSHPGFAYLQMDVAKFFPSIDREILLGLLSERIGDPRFFALLRSLVSAAPGERGIPIGNLTSQTLANLYLDTLDQEIKRKQRVRCYIRYMDDLVLLAENYEAIARLRKRIEEFTDERLKLSFHPNKVNIGLVREGITFLGHRIFPDAILMRGKSLRRFRRKLRARLTLDQKVKRALSYQGHVVLAKNRVALASEFSRIAFAGEGFL